MIIFETTVLVDWLIPVRATLSPVLNSLVVDNVMTPLSSSVAVTPLEAVQVIEVANGEVVISSLYWLTTLYPTFPDFLSVATGAVSERTSIPATFSFSTFTEPVRALSVNPVTLTVYSPSNNLLASSISADFLSSENLMLEALTVTEPFLISNLALETSTAFSNVTFRALELIALI